ncbi:CatB-related O-acetyltransferase, partial [Aeromonas hydrophila]
SLSRYSKSTVRRHRRVSHFEVEFAKFIMNGANHQTSGFSTYPFFIFGNGWESAAPAPGSLPYKGDTVIGNDVWIGYDALIMPGVKVGNGAIIAARSVVTGDVPAYAVVGGNPAKVIRYRFDDDTIARLNAIAWWDWPVEQISRNLKLIGGGEIAELEKNRVMVINQGEAKQLHHSNVQS